MDLILIISDSEQRAVEEWGTYMKRNTVIFECSGIGPKIIFGFFGGEKFIKIFISSSKLFQNFEKIDLENWNLRAIP